MYVSVNLNMYFYLDVDKEMWTVLWLVDPKYQQLRNVFICWHVWCVYEIGTKIPFSKWYRYVINHLHLYVTNYYIFVCIITLLLLTMCLTQCQSFLKYNIPTIVIFG